MNSWLPGVRRPVRRLRADRYLLIMLLSFAASVTLTRLFLYLTGYPQLGSGQLHVAHVLWGGAMLFVAALLPLIYANRWSLLLGAGLSGLGIGLFIDEVGKFITQTNDYFFPAAAPIIYAIFLLTVFLYLQVRRPLHTDARAHLYHALDALEEVLDHDLEPDERREMLLRLRYASTRTVPGDLARLGRALLGFFEDEALHLAPDTPNAWKRIQASAVRFEARWLPPGRLKAIVAVGLVGLGSLAIWNLLSLLRAAADPVQLGRIVSDLVAAGKVASASGLSWFLARLALEGTVGTLQLIASGLILLRKEAAGLRLGQLALLLSLVAVNLVVLYFEQFSSLGLAALQFAVLLALGRYQRRVSYADAGRLHRISERKSA